MQQMDSLTGFLSKEVMSATLDRLQAESSRDNKPLTVLLVDMDHFKAYNEKFGHLEGDNVLKYFAGTLRVALLNEQTFTFRFGGDEFIIAFPGKKAREVYRVAQNMAKIFKKRPFLLGDRLYKMYFSAGIATYPTDGIRIKEVIHKADMAMYFSKTQGRARTTICSSVIWKRLAKIVYIGTCISLTLWAVLYFNRTSCTDRIRSWLKESAGKIRMSRVKPQVKPQVKTDLSCPVLVYLKSGRVVRGTIVHYNEDEIELRLNVDAGKGSVTFKKSNIDRIDNENE